MAQTDPNFKMSEAVEPTSELYDPQKLSLKIPNVKVLKDVVPTHGLYDPQELSSTFPRDQQVDLISWKKLVPNQVLLVSNFEQLYILLFRMGVRWFCFSIDDEEKSVLESNMGTVRQLIENLRNEKQVQEIPTADIEYYEAINEDISLEIDHGHNTLKAGPAHSEEKCVLDIIFYEIYRGIELRIEHYLREILKNIYNTPYCDRGQILNEAITVAGNAGSCICSAVLESIQQELKDAQIITERLPDINSEFIRLYETEESKIKSLSSECFNIYYKYFSIHDDALAGVTLLLRETLIQEKIWKEDHLQELSQLSNLHHVEEGGVGHR